jgi:hypothetical protein
MMRNVLFCLTLCGCGGLSWNTTVADHAQVRASMLESVVADKTTEKSLVSRWGNPTQKIREGGQVSYVYRNMENPPGYRFPQFGNSSAFVVVEFQFGLAVRAYSSDTQRCRATFAPRPPGAGFDNPATVHPSNCGIRRNGDASLAPQNHAKPIGVPVDSYDMGGAGKYR